MKILWLSPTPSHPPTAGNRAHILQLGSKLIDAGHDILFLLYNQENASEADLIEMRKFWPRFFAIPHLKKARKMSLGNQWGVDDWFNSDIEQAIRFFAKEDFDLFMVEYVFLSKAFLFGPKDAIKVLYTHDRMSGRDEVLKAAGLKPSFFYTTPEQEAIGLGRADIVLAVSESERAFFASLGNCSPMELGYNPPVERLEPAERASRLRVGIIGSANPANVKSAQALLDAIDADPGLSAKIEIILAGPLCAPFQDSSATLLGIVESETEFYKRIDLAINPSLGGTGVKIKTIAAFKHGRPFISTMDGSSGLQVRHPAHLCSGPDGMIPWLRRLTDSASGTQTLNELQGETDRIAVEYDSRKSILFDRFIERIESKKKRVLLVTDIPFWERNTGMRDAISSLCRFLKTNFRFDLFFFGSLWPQRLEMLRRAGLDTAIISYKDYEKQADDLKLTMRKESWPPFLQYKYNTSFLKSFKLFLNKSPRYDCVVIPYFYNSYLLDAIDYNCLKILDTNDIFSTRVYTFHGVHDTLPITLEQEIAIFDRFDGQLFVSLEEYERARALVRKSIPVYRGFSPQLREIPFPEAGIHFGFLGSKNKLNYEAIDWFIKNVWPLQDREDAILHIFGEVSSYFGCLPANIRVHGAVEPVEEAYRSCHVMLAPLFHGSGIKIKTLEALAAGRPVLASPEAARGIGRNGRNGIYLASSREEFVSGMLRLSHESALRERLAQEGVATIRELFAEETLLKPLAQLIKSY